MLTAWLVYTVMTTIGITSIKKILTNRTELKSNKSAVEKIKAEIEKLKSHITTADDNIKKIITEYYILIKIIFLLAVLRI